VCHPNKKINKETAELHNTIDQTSTECSTQQPQEYTGFFSAVHGTFSNMGHTLGHKATLDKYKKPEITSCMLSDHVE
jgi:hypothetical protein